MADDFNDALTERASPIVSVVMPFFNSERFIEEAIQSVLAQTLESWELLLVDDGSTDQSSAIAKRFAEKVDNRIQYLEHFNHANCGKSSSRNRGVEVARGRYVTFLDSDDVFLPEKLEHQVGILDRNQKAVMLYGRTEYWFSWDAEFKIGGRDEVGKIGLATDRLYEPPLLLTAFLEDSGMVPCICSILARRSTVLSVGAFEESVQHLYEDQIFLAKMILAGPVYVESGCGERYRQHPWSSSSLAIKSGEYHPTRPNQARAKFLNWLEDYMQTQRTTPDLDRALNAALSPYKPTRFSGGLLRFLRSPTNRR